MKTLFNLLVYCLLIQSGVCAQNEKGCGIGNSFSIIHHDNSEGTALILLLCQNELQYYPVPCKSANDTVYVVADEDDLISIVWSYKDEYYCQPITDNDLLNVKWYRDDSLLNDSLYSVYHYQGGVNCCTTTHAGTKLQTNIPGYYQFRKFDNYNTNYPVIAIQRPEPEVITEEVVSITVAPNPARETLQIRHGKLINGVLTLFGNDGRLILDLPIDPTSTETIVPLNELGTGSYCLVISSVQGELFRERIIKM